MLIYISTISDRADGKTNGRILRSAASHRAAHGRRVRGAGPPARHSHGPHPRSRQILNAEIDWCRSSPASFDSLTAPVLPRWRFATRASSTRLRCGCCALGREARPRPAVHQGHQCRAHQRPFFDALIEVSWPAGRPPARVPDPARSPRGPPSEVVTAPTVGRQRPDSRHSPRSAGGGAFNTAPSISAGTGEPRECRTAHARRRAPTGTSTSGSDTYGPCRGRDPAQIAER